MFTKTNKTLHQEISISQSQCLTNFLDINWHSLWQCLINLLGDKLAQSVAVFDKPSWTYTSTVCDKPSWTYTSTVCILAQSEAVFDKPSWTYTSSLWQCFIIITLLIF